MENKFLIIRVRVHHNADMYLAPPTPPPPLNTLPLSLYIYFQNLLSCEQAKILGVNMCQTLCNNASYLLVTKHLARQFVYSANALATRCKSGVSLACLCVRPA